MFNKLVCSGSLIGGCAFLYVGWIAVQDSMLVGVAMYLPAIIAFLPLLLRVGGGVDLEQWWNDRRTIAAVLSDMLVPSALGIGIGAVVTMAVAIAVLTI